MKKRMAWSSVQSVVDAGRRWLRRTPAGVGIDVGSHAIKVVSLCAPADAGVRVQALARPAPPPPSGGAWLDVEGVAAELRDALQHAGLRAPSAAVALPSSVAVFRRVVVPNSGRRTFDRSVEAAIEALDLDPGEDWNVDFEVLGPLPRGDGQEVLCVAAPADCVAAYVEMLRQADVLPVAVDVDILALVRGCGSEDLAPDKVTGLIDIGESNTTIHLVRGNRSLFQGRLGVGVRDVRESLAEQLAIAPAEVLRQNLTALDGGTSQTDALGLAVARVGEEIHHAVSFFWAAPGEEAIDRLRLSGGGAAIPALRRWLETRLAVPCRVADPCRDLNLLVETDDPDVATLGPEYALAVGLAARCLGAA